MDRVFAPWRINWVERDDGEDSGCIFCNLATGNADRDNRVVARNEHGYVVLNNAPYNPGHTLVIPNEHIEDYAELDIEVLVSIHRLVQRAITALRKTFSPEGFNMGMNMGAAGGASIDDHLHLHVIPRWQRDTTFLPTTANAKVIVEALDETYDRLHTAFENMDNTYVSAGSRAVYVPR